MIDKSLCKKAALMGIQPVKSLDSGVPALKYGHLFFYAFSWAPSITKRWTPITWEKWGVMSDERYGDHESMNVLRNAIGGLSYV